MPSTLSDLLPSRRDAPSDDLLDRFLEYVDDRGLALYPAQAKKVVEAKGALGWRGTLVSTGPLTAASGSG